MILFVWDLHGTLEQGNEDAAREISNLILEKYDYPVRFSDSMGKQLYGRRWYEYFEYLLPDEPHERHVELQEASFGLSNSPAGARIITRYVRPSKNAVKVLDTIHRSAHDQVIISNTTPQSLPAYLDALEILPYFDTSHALAVNRHSREAMRTKADVLNDYKRGKRFDRIVVIGDSDGDMQLAEGTDGVGYLYAHEGTPFRSERGEYKIHDLIEVLREIEAS